MVFLLLFLFLFISLESFLGSTASYILWVFLFSCLFFLYFYMWAWHVHVYIHICVYVAQTDACELTCTYVIMNREVRGWCQESSWLLYLIHWGSTALQLIAIINLVSQFTLGSPLSLPSEAEIVGESPFSLSVYLDFRESNFLRLA